MSAPEEDDRKVPFVLKWVWVVGPVMVVTAMALMVIELKTPSSRRVITAGPQMQIFARHGEAQFPVGDGKQLAVGDTLRFIVEPAGRKYLLIVAVDAMGQTTVFYPYGGTTSALLPPGDQLELPGSVLPDAVKGKERVTAIFSDAPYDAERAAASLRAGERPYGVLPGLALTVTYEKL
jgi:hypothetical protein